VTSDERKKDAEVQTTFRENETAALKSLSAAVKFVGFTQAICGRELLAVAARTGPPALRI